MLNCPTCEFADFEKDKCTRLLNRLPGICPYAEERKPRNHFEMVKAMSMEEMAEFLDEVLIKNPHCKPEKNCTNDGSCGACLVEWLKEAIADG